jgi:outer membrane protein assembly factor BamB
VTSPQSSQHNRKQIRVWPGVVAVTVLFLLRFGLTAVMPDATLFALGGMGVGALAVLIWWLFFSRLPMLERWGAIVVILAAVAVTPPILDRSIATGMMGLMFRFYVIPGLCLALVAATIISRGRGAGFRRGLLMAGILAACGFWALLRTEGITGEGHAQLAWRWTKTPEQRLLAQTNGEAAHAAAPPAAPVEVPREPVAAAPVAKAAEKAPEKKPAVTLAASATPEWPGFRGPNRDGVVTGVRINTDWSSSPPVQIWRRQVGPAWSSFAVSDGLVYTEEQRGEFEEVVCYNEKTGDPVWTHRDAARFWESNGGAGPRSTPALRDGHVYTFGATGILNALDAADGRVVWTRNAASDAGVQVPEWGFASSPLVTGELVIVAVAGKLAAYDLGTGNRRWLGPEGRVSYSSPQLMNLGGVPQIVLLNGDGAISVGLQDGTLLWKHVWPGFASLQPAMTPDFAVLMANGDAGGGAGTRRLTVKHGPNGWTAEEAWTSSGLKPYFNDMVIHKGHAYGFDGGILACIDLQDGKRKWKGGRYGHGQLLLVADQDLLVVLSEEGELALVAAAPDQFTEIARMQALEGKTWNHPALAGNILLVRNGQEMVAFRMPRVPADETKAPTLPER